MKLVFFGSGAFGVPTLEALCSTHTVALIVTQPARPAGRGGRPTPTPVALWAAEHAPHIPVIAPEKVNDAAIVAQIHAVHAPLWVVIAFGQFLGRKLLSAAPAINLHASLLPRWRGAAPINAAILAGDTVTGNSIIDVSDRMDAGAVLAQSRRTIEPHLTAGELHDLLAADGPALMLRTIEHIAEGAAHRTPQDESLVTLAPKMSKEHGSIDFARTSDECRCTIHGYTPWPGVTVRYRGEPLKLLRAQSLPASANIHPGAILDPAQGTIACGVGTLRLIEVQPAGKRPMTWSEFHNGRRCLAGEQLEGGPAR